MNRMKGTPKSKNLATFDIEEDYCKYVRILTSVSIIRKKISEMKEECSGDRAKL